jgi:hypothetical protein
MRVDAASKTPPFKDRWRSGIGKEREAALSMLSVPAFLVHFRCDAYHAACAAATRPWTAFAFAFSVIHGVHYHRYRSWDTVDNKASLPGAMHSPRPVQAGNTDEDRSSCRRKNPT